MNKLYTINRPKTDAESGPGGCPGGRFGGAWGVAKKGKNTANSWNHGGGMGVQ